MKGYLFIEFTTPPRCARQVKSQKFSKNLPLGTHQKKRKKKHLFSCVSLSLWYSYIMTKQFENDKGEIVDCEEIATKYPSPNWYALNAKQHQEAADKHNNGKLGKARRFFSANDIEMYVDIDCKVWWEENCR